jgi:PEP-CTERM motif
MNRMVAAAMIGYAMMCAAAKADTTVKVDPTSNWVGFMNVFEIPSHGGGYVFGSGWGTADLTAVFSGPVLTLGPNTIGDPNPFWYTPSGGPGAVGNKTMDASMYVEQPAGTYAGQTVTFTGNVLSNTLVGHVNQVGDGWTSVAFIKDFAPDYSSSVSVTMPLAPGPFSISLAAINNPARHVQYGFETIGPDVWITDVGPYGNVQIAAVPEPATLMLLGMGSIAIAACGVRGCCRGR